MKKDLGYAIKEFGMFFVALAWVALALFEASVIYLLFRVVFAPILGFEHPSFGMVFAIGTTAYALTLLISKMSGSTPEDSDD